MCRCDERLRVKVEGSTLFGYTGLCGGLVPTPKNRDEVDRRECVTERFQSVKGECVIGSDWLSDCWSVSCSSLSDLNIFLLSVTCLD